MNSLLAELNQICTKNPFKEKIIIVDNHAIGEQINQAFVKVGYSAINLKFKTVLDLAKNVLELKSNRYWKSLDHTIGVHFTYTILKQLKETGALQYFSGMEITPSFSHAIFSTIQTLRLSGYTKNTFNQNAFISLEKAADLIEIMGEFEDILKVNQLFDRADILNHALEFARIETEKLFILQSNLQLFHLEEQLLAKMLPESTTKLPLAPVLGIDLPEGTSLSSIRWGEQTPLSYLYQQDGAQKAENVRIFTSKTEELEVKQILAQIKTSTTPLDESVVYYTSPDDYSTLFFHLSQKIDLPVTFGEGLSVSFSRPGRLVSGLINWIQSNYSVQELLNLLNEGLLELGEAVPTKSRIAKILRDLQVGWSQDRYLSLINAEIEQLDGDEMRVSELIALKRWLSGIFKKLPPYQTNMDYKNCLSGIAYVLTNHSKTNSALDEMSKTSLIEEIEKISAFADETLPAYDVFEKVKDLLLSIRVNQSRSKPGHLHIDSYKNGLYNSRSNVFVVGLDNKKFPGNSSEDPLLLDQERMEINRDLPLLRDQGKVNLYRLLQLLAHSTGRVFISYCNYDMNDNRVVNPAFIVLQCYRLMTGQQDAEFKQLKTLQSSIIANDIFEDKEFWNEKLTNDSTGLVSEGILKHFYPINKGILAEIARHSNHVTEFDGVVHLNVDHHDPRLNPDKTMSAGRLETLAKCPYSYFLKEVLRVKPVEEISFDAHKWLDPATRGSLLHSIFEQFYKGLAQGKVKPNYALHLDQLIILATGLIEQQREILPPPNERVYIRELNDLLECCKIFLKEEERHSEDYQPLHFEYSFGLEDREPAVIKLPSGEVKIAGIVDRVDQSKDGFYHIIDYKTGSTYGYKKNGAFNGGRQLQHMIYALAIEQHLGIDEGSVTESSYYFPTVKGMAERYIRKQDKTLRTNGTEILEKLIDLIRNGQFEMTDDANDCKYCEFKLVCRRHFYPKEIMETKWTNQKLKGVRGYD
ncbi:PD-(D/E)XK nuclease family protein [Neobacillus sp. LXY-1]|uniref:PD-(D/E)XK nuclease family protein n=1 Tax=Neobacillus sp. LXY-1 TaxID=3379133 RepID=UPI003EE36BA8